MPGTERMWAGELTTVGTEQLYSLGTERLEDHATLGLRTWVYIFVTAASAGLAKGSGAAQDAASSNPYKVELTPSSSNSSRVRGVGDHVIAAGSYGWIIKEGSCEFLSDGTTTADVGQEPSSTAGQWTNVAASTDMCNAHAYETESPAGAGNLAGGYINA